MILHRLELSNFRQFRGTQSVQFAGSTEASNKNVTVILGENGRGKTSLFRAIMFALFGERRIRQDEDISQDELHLVNSVALEDARKEDKPVTSYVSLTFFQGDSKYVIKRELLGSFSKDIRVEEFGRVQLYITRPDGNTLSKTDPAEVDAIINSVMDRKICEYFLFDGEKIQRLTLASIEQRREISKGIRNLLNIDSLERSIKAIELLRKKLDKELSQKSSGEYKQVLNRIALIEEEKAFLSEENRKKENEYELAAAQKKKINQQLEAYVEIKSLLKERTDLENKLAELETSLKSTTLEIRDKNGKAPFLLLGDTVREVYSLIDQKKKKGEIPSEIRKDLIEKILADKTCICGRDVVPGTAAFNNIIEWKNKIIDTTLENTALTIWQLLGAIKNQGSDLYNLTKKCIEEYAKIEIDIGITTKKISELGVKIGASDREDATKLEKLRQDIEKDQICLQASIQNNGTRIKDLSDEYETLRSKRERLEKDEKLKDEIMKRARLAEQTCEALASIHNEFTIDVKQKIEAEANTYLGQLLDTESRKTLNRIVVGEDYSLQITDKWNNSFLANISAGQRQVMSISFIAALANVASAGKTLEMPLFMDTPFGRLSLEHRRRLLKQLPDYCAQWILLATDTEFRKEEAKLLNETGRWGQLYQLEGEGPGATQIMPRKVSEAGHILLNNVENNGDEDVR